jgi:hypothetical protein
MNSQAVQPMDAEDDKSSSSSSYEAPTVEYVDAVEINSEVSSHLQDAASCGGKIYKFLKYCLCLQIEGDSDDDDMESCDLERAYNCKVSIK